MRGEERHGRRQVFPPSLLPRLLLLLFIHLCPRLSFHPSSVSPSFMRGPVRFPLADSEQASRIWPWLCGFPKRFAREAPSVPLALSGAASEVL